jgi:hypothetical protein
VWGYDKDRSAFFLLDPWPEDYNITRATTVKARDLPAGSFYSVADMGTGKSGIIEGWKGAILTKVEWRHLERAIARVKTIATPNAIDFFRRAIIADSDAVSIGPEPLLALADTMLLSGSERFTAETVQIGTEALRLAILDKDESVRKLAASRLYAATLARAGIAKRDSDFVAETSIRALLDDLVGHYSLRDLEQELVGRRLAAVAHRLILGRFSEHALELLERHAATEPTEPSNEMMLIGLLTMSGREDEGRMRADSALFSFSTRIAELEQLLNRMSPIDVINKEWTSHEKLRLESIQNIIRKITMDEGG